MTLLEIVITGLILALLLAIFIGFGVYVNFLIRRAIRTEPGIEVKLKPKPVIRWKVVVTYRSKFGLIDVTHDVSEIYEVDDLVEKGPSWMALESVVITLHESYPGPRKLLEETIF